MGHGGGGKLSAELVEHLFLPAFRNEALERWATRRCWTCRGAAGSPSRPIRTSSGRCSSPAAPSATWPCNGTVNDLAMVGARPLYLSAGFILEEGFPIDQLGGIVHRMAEAARRAGVALVTGDTKVVERGHGDGCYINTAGRRDRAARPNIGPHRARPGDAVLVSGTIGDHGMAIMSVREGLEFETLIDERHRPAERPGAEPARGHPRHPRPSRPDPRRRRGDAQRDRRPVAGRHRPRRTSPFRPAPRSSPPASCWASTPCSSPTKASSSPSCPRAGRRVWPRFGVILSGEAARDRRRSPINIPAWS